MIVSLVGLRGVGKTSVAKTLAALLASPWADLDAEIERRSGRSVAQILQHDGEPAFRELESAALVELLQGPGRVLATGGGIVLREANRRLLAAAGPVVWLQASTATICSRLTADATQLAARPALTPAGTLEELDRLAAERGPLYGRCATIEVATDARDVRAVAGEIVERLALASGRLH